MKQFVKENQEAKNQTIIIFSAFQAGQDKLDNWSATAEADTILKCQKIQFVKGEGYYKGEREDCFICKPKDLEEHRFIIALAFDKYHQESVLVRVTQGVYLIYQEVGKYKMIGDNLKAVPKHKALAMDAYTKIDERYFVAV